MNTPSLPKSTQKSLATLSLAALGVVYGDIGTSPLYAFAQVFANGRHSVPITQENILGVLSLFFWSLMMIVTVKYVLFIMRANNQGEGGIMALMALALSKVPKNTRLSMALLGLGLVGASFFYGDGVITPAISVLSAVEGLELISPKLKDLVIPVALGILCLLFWTQRKGTGTIGLFFGPIMLIWFACIGLLGLWQVMQHPIVLEALNPLYALQFIDTHGLLSFFALGAVVLCLTGAEALYADMGHFGVIPIRIVWIGLVLPTLLLNYLGQGALLLSQPDTLSKLFYLLAPSVLQTPLIVLATIATVIASQAVISGAFSMTHQAIQLGVLPRLRILHTSAEEIGQIYLPLVNILLATMVVTVILLFKSSNALGSAYGIAVTGTMLITDFLAIAVATQVWGWQPWRALLGAGSFIVIDTVFFSANTLKFMEGGWLPILLSVGMIILMTTWYRGHKTLEQQLRAQTIPLTEFLASEVTEVIPRTRGTAIYLATDADLTPTALRRTLRHFGVIHEQVAILSIHYELVPYVSDAARLFFTQCDKGFLQLRLHCGFMEHVSIPDILKAHWPINLLEHWEPVSYFVSNQAIMFDDSEGMRTWRKHLFQFMYRNGQLPTEVFSLPIADAMAVAVRATI